MVATTSMSASDRYFKMLDLEAAGGTKPAETSDDETPAGLPLVNERYRCLVYTAAAATGLAASALFTPWEAVRIIGATVLTGVGYGILNDMIACRDCIEYFTVGHIYDERNLENRPLNTLNPNLNALAWGAIATWSDCAIAGGIFAFLAQTPFPNMAVSLGAAQLAPYIGAFAGLAFIVSHIRSRNAQKAMNENPTEKYPEVPLDFQAGWEACNVRNGTGYASIGIGGTILSIAMLISRAGVFSWI